MNWIQETFLQPTMIQTVAVICIVCAIGVYLGKLKYKGVSLGIYVRTSGRSRFLLFPEERRSLTQFSRFGCHLYRIDHDSSSALSDRHLCF